VGVMQKLLSTLGSEGFDTLSAPDTWDTDGSGTDSFKDGKVEVPRGSREYREVETYFMTALHSQANHISVHKIERIQNLPLWQSYSVKKQTMLTRDTNNPTGRENNLDITDVERRWLFHGTTTEIVLKVERQGFNRAFAGRNAVAYGKGVYFARDASYSSHKLYSAPDKKGIQRIFLCRVAVGDWCKGTNGQLTPDPKKNNPMELFDTTVDNVSNPSIFVGYHDAQAYPEYLVSFKNSDTVAC
jgi:poly [ADP-ribose] polymerase 10/14/15